MADLSKLMKKRLGAPPPPEDASDNLSAPEVAPAAPHVETRRYKPEDGRTLRKTGRTIQFATRVSVTFDKKFRSIAKRDGLLMTELLEKAIEAYEKEDSR